MALPGSPHEDTGPFSVWWPPKLITRVDPEYDHILMLLWNRGVRAVWETQSVCPCGAYGDNSPLKSCPVCGGTGEEFHHAQQVRLTSVGASIDVDQFNRPFINYERGTVLFTLRTEHGPKKRDRITLTDGRVTLEDVRVRSTSEFDSLRYPIVPAEYIAADGSTYTVSVIHLRSGTANGGPAGSVLELGTDFEVTEDGKIDWAKGDVLETAPAPGVHYTIVYKTRPVYRVLRHPHVVRDTRTALKIAYEKHLSLPVQVMCGLEWEPEQL